MNKKKPVKQIPSFAEGHFCKEGGGDRLKENKDSFLIKQEPYHGFLFLL